MEREPNSPEQINLPKPELEKRPERATSPEISQESEAKRQRQVEQARQTIERQQETADTGERAPVAKAKAILTNIDYDRAYKDTMQSLQRHLKPASRTFSRVIHNPAIERVSEVAGQTVARPSVMLGATTTALIVGSLTYATAKRYGFTLSGSELILSLLAGGVIGAIIEGLTKLFKRR